MANLFSKSAIKQAISMYQWLDISREIAIVQELYDDFRKGNMKDETRYEQNFNELFFHQLLGYDPKMNFHPKASTPVGSKIADVWLGFFAEGLYSYEGVKVVVELKWCETMLDKKQASYGGQSPVDQGFGYKTSFTHCPWLIVSNFASVRLYRDNKQDFELWTIEDLANPDNDYYHLKTLLALLKRNHLISASGTSYTETILSEVRSKQEQITKDFYKQYKTLRLELINDIRQHNTDVTVEVAVEKAQKIIDRIIFIHFCEDRGLLPEGKLKTNLLKGHEVDLTPWEVLKLYFRGVDKWSEKLGIPNGYNGWLFQDDAVLNALEIGNTICHKFIDLGHYNFDDELSVNILGHIFEQSISDIEQLKGELLVAQIPPTPFDKGEEKGNKKESKRKKDGIFYTPEYIVDYIVQNSLMTYLEEKENECLAQIGKKWWYKTEIEAYQAYQHILQQVKVLDPACGSGAFLVRVFDYLYAENKRVGEIIGSLFSTDEIYKSILRDNIYGVDLNPESVEITKLSLWLKSAQQGKKLNNLDANIKCGNSLIDDPTVAGDRAFDRKKEFSDIMGAWGFDVIVGNPPYVLSRDSIFEEQKSYLANHYSLIHEKPNLYILFMEKTYNLLSSNGSLWFIVPNSWLWIDSGKKLRKFLLGNVLFEKMINLQGQSFPWVNVETMIFTYQKKNSKLNRVKYITITDMLIPADTLFDNILQSEWLDNRNQMMDLASSQKDISIIDALKKYTKLEELFEVRVWLQAYEKWKWKPKQTVDDVKNHVFDYDHKFDKDTYPYFGGWDIGRYSYSRSWQWLRHWERLSQPKELRQFTEKRILIREITSNFPKVLNATFVEETFLNNKSIINILQKSSLFDLKYLLAILNSSLISFYHVRRAVKGNRTLFPKVVINDVKNYPIPNISLSNQKPFIDKADTMLSLTTELHEKIDSFLRYISSKFWLEKLSTKLQKFYDYDFTTFLKELKGAKLSMTEEAELMEFFESKKSGIVALKNRIDATDREIDAMVFELYGLSEEEREVVKGG